MENGNYERRNKTERLLSYTAILSGLAMANPGNHYFNLVPAHTMIALLGTRYLWGTIVVMVGLTQRIAVWTKGPQARFIAASTSCLLWFTLAIFFWLGEITGATNPVWAIFTLRVSLSLVFGLFQAELCAALFRSNSSGNPDS